MLEDVGVASKDVVGLVDGAPAVHARFNIHFGGVEVVVAEELFEGEEVHAVFVAVGGEGVSEGVGGDVAAHGLVFFGEAGLGGVFFKESLGLAFGDGHDFGVGGLVGLPLAEFEFGFFVDEGVAVFVSFAGSDEEEAFGVADVGKDEATHFGDADAGGVENPEEETVALVVGSGDELEDFFASGDGGETFSSNTGFVAEFVTDFVEEFAVVEAHGVHPELAEPFDDFREGGGFGEFLEDEVDDFGTGERLSWFSGLVGFGHECSFEEQLQKSFGAVASVGLG